MKTFQLLAIVLATLFFQLPDQTHGFELTENEAIAQLLQEMTEQNEGTSELELEDNMAESELEERLLEETREIEPQHNMMLESQSAASRFNLKIDGCDGMSSSTKTSLEKLLRPFGNTGGDVTVTCPAKC